MLVSTAIIDMKESDNNKISSNIIDFIDHCNGFTNDRRRGFWLLDEINKPNSINIKKAFEKCLKTLRRINKESVNKDAEFILIDRVYELNYRILGRYLNRKIKRETLEYLQKINYFVQGIICSDVKNLDKHYELNKNL